MLRLAIVTPNPVAAAAIEQVAQESGAFHIVLNESRHQPMQEAVRAIAMGDPEVVLLDVGDWPAAAPLADKILQASRRAALIGFRPEWTPEQQTELAGAGIADLLREPFSAAEMEAAAYQAVHRRRPVNHQNVLAFLPAKAGSGCSTVALHTAAAMANVLERKTLLLETDRRSGVLSILLDVEDRGGLPRVLEQSGSLTSIEWRQHLVEIKQLDLLLANPAKPGRLPTWIDYYQLLLFVQSQYDHIVVDLPEVINPATAEVVKAARSVFIVCQPELPSLRLASLRRAELESCEIPPEKIRLLVNRWQTRRMNQEQVMNLAQCPVFGWLPNDYAAVKNATLEARLVLRDSAFGKACLELARRLTGLPEPPGEGSALSLLRRLGRPHE